MSGPPVPLWKALHRRARGSCLGDGVPSSAALSSAKSDSSQGCRTEGGGSLDIRLRARNEALASPGKHIFVCSIHPSDLLSMSTHGAIWLGMMSQESRTNLSGLLLSCRPHCHPMASITSPRAAKQLVATPGTKGTAKPGHARGGNGASVGLKQSFVGHLSLALAPKPGSEQGWREVLELCLKQKPCRGPAEPRSPGSTQPAARHASIL